jgi:hypothetical protein
MPDLHVHPTISLADFIRENKEPILSGWEAFARSKGGVIRKSPSLQAKAQRTSELA